MAPDNLYDSNIHCSNAKEQINPIYAKHLPITAKIFNEWFDTYPSDKSWEKTRRLRLDTAKIIEDYLEEEMRKYRKLWTDALQPQLDMLEEINREPWYKRIFKTKSS